MTQDAAKVIWTEGLFLRPQHFQQLERYLEALVDARFGSLFSAQEGFLELEIDKALLKRGKLGVTKAAGVFSDGTPFNVSNVSTAFQRLAPFEVDDSLRNEVVYLGVTMRRGAGQPVALDDKSSRERRSRYVAEDAKVADEVIGFGRQADLKLGSLVFTVGPRAAIGDAMVSLPLARVKERQANNVIIDEEFVPPLLDLSCHPRARGWLEELHGIVNLRAEMLAQRFADAGGGHESRVASETELFLVLALCNRYDALLSHLKDLRPLHPLSAFNELLKLAGECATFGRPRRRPEGLKGYLHRDLPASFEPLIEEIRRAMERAIDESAVQIALEPLGPGAFLANVPDVGLIAHASFVLMAASRAQPDDLRAYMLAQIKIGARSEMESLLKLNLTGIELQPMPRPPRELPFHEGFQYFQLVRDPSNERNATNWRSAAVTRSFGLSVHGSLPGLRLELWAIKRSTRQ